MKKNSAFDGKAVYFAERADWRTWLAENYTKEKEVWLIYPKKASGKPRIPYNDAVEEALCFGWIDSQAKSIDENSYAQRFSPRRPKSKYSQPNKERLRELVRRAKSEKELEERLISALGTEDLGLVLPEVQATLTDVLAEEFTMPEDILDEIKANKAAWANFQKFSPAYKRIRVAFIEGARNRPAEFKKRLRHFIEMTEKNKRFGFGGIEKYY